jgi:hypothetical protein
MKAWVLVLISLALCPLPAAAGDIRQELLKHSVWVTDGLKWEQEEGGPQTFAGGTILCFGSKGEFGSFSGVIIKYGKYGKRLMLSEGDGQLVQAGTWTVSEN